MEVCLPVTVFLCIYPRASEANIPHYTMHTVLSTGCYRQHNTILELHLAHNLSKSRKYQSDGRGPPPAPELLDQDIASQ